MKKLSVLWAMLLLPAASLAQVGGPGTVVVGGGGSGGSGDVTGPSSSTDNALVRFDSTTGKIIQTSNLTCSDVSGVTTTLATITPAATTGATVAGQSLAVTASPAVASTDTAGAAAGGGFTFNGGAAARNASGNANGGGGSFLGGTGIGTGRVGYWGINTASPTRPLGVLGMVQGGSIASVTNVEATFTAAIDNGYQSYYGGNTEAWGLAVTNHNGVAVHASIGTDNNGNALVASRNSGDLLFGYQTFGDFTQVARLVNQGTNLGLLQLSGWTSTYGKNALTADYTNATATMSNLTALSTTLVAARKYTFRMVLRFSDSVAAEGAAFDFDGGTATATDFGANCQIFDAGLLLSADSTALATDFAVATSTGASKIVCDGSFTVNAAGTFIPRAAQNSHTTGTLTVELGSHLLMEDVSFN